MQYDDAYILGVLKGTLRKHVVESHEKFISQGKLPKDTDWRPLRFASRDIVFGIVVIRHSRRDNLLEVNVCLTTDPPQYPRFSGEYLTMLALFSEAYKSGGSMEIRFTEKVWAGQIPQKIVAYAESLDVQLGHIQQGVITPKEARDFYLALTGFSSSAERRVMELGTAGLVSSNRICYMVHHGIWSKPEMEHILLSAQYPERVLLGASLPEHGILWVHDLLVARQAILGGYMDRKLHKKVRLTERGEEELEGDANWVTISFDPETGAKVYQYYEDLKLPWMDQESILTAGQKLYALVRARNANEFVQFGRKDLMAMLRLVQTHGEKNLYAVLVPRDFLETPQWFQDQFRSALDSFGTHLLVCPEFVDTFDVDAAGRLDRSRRLRNDLPAELSEIREITRPRSTEFTMVTLPRVAGLQYVNLDVRKLLRWSESLLRDIAAGSNPEIVRSRYNRVRDRIEFAALGLLHSGEYSVRAATFGADCLDQLVQAANETPSQGTTLISSPDVQEWQRFLDQSAREGSNVIEILDVCGPTSMEGSNVPLDDHQLQQAFRRLQARDTATNNGNLPTEVAILRTSKSIIQDVRGGLPGALNMNGLSPETIWKVLHGLVFTSEFGPGGLYVPVVYADGSRAADFPVGCLRTRSDDEMIGLRPPNHPTRRFGMVSCRHPQLDRLVQMYWFLNIQISRPVTDSETDALAYQLSLKEFEKRRGRSWRFEFYLTGFEPALVGFLRALTEELLQHAEETPKIEVVPRYYRGEKQDPMLDLDQNGRLRRAWH